MTDYETEHPATYRLAERLVREARNRAPSFVLFNQCFEESPSAATEYPEMQECIREAAREYLEKENRE